MMNANKEKVRFDDRGLVPAIVQEAVSGRVLMLAYMNEESLKLSLETGYATFWSRSRQKLWKKGETSGHVQKIQEISYDCDADTLLIVVDQTGPACHTGQKSCFYRLMKRFTSEKPDHGSQWWQVLKELGEVIEDRRVQPREGSYVRHLFQSGETLIQSKVMEESREVVEASRDHDKGQIIYEAADLVFHLMVLLSFHGLDFHDVTRELAGRFGNPPKKNIGEKTDR